jgi:hypothetical protein
VVVSGLARAENNRLVFWGGGPVAATASVDGDVLTMVMHGLDKLWSMRSQLDTACDCRQGWFG